MKDSCAPEDVPGSGIRRRHRQEHDDLAAVARRRRQTVHRQAAQSEAQGLVQESLRRVLPVEPGTGEPMLRAHWHKARVARATLGWDDLRIVFPGVRRHFLSGTPLVNHFRKDPVAKAFDLLRTRLLQTLKANGWHRIAIAAPTAGCGSTFTAVNLAQSLSRVRGTRTVLMDLNQRRPGVAAALEMAGVGDTSGFLSGKVPLDKHVVRISDTLAVGLTATPASDAAELLQGVRCAEALNRMIVALRPDTVLYDLPPVLACDDLAAFLPQVDGVLLVADGTRTLARHLAACRQVIQGQTQLLGVILNRARSSSLENLEP